MALFNDVSKQEKNEQKIQEMMNRLGLDRLSDADYKSCKKILNDLFGLGLMKAGMALSFAKSEEQCKVGYLSAMVEQNWIIIRQLDELNQRLDWMMRNQNNK